MKFPSKMTFVAVLAGLLGSTVCAYAFFAPNVNPVIFRTAIPSEEFFKPRLEREAQAVAIPTVPAAHPCSLEQAFRAQRLFEHSA